MYSHPLNLEYRELEINYIDNQSIIFNTIIKEFIRSRFPVHSPLVL